MLIERAVASLVAVVALPSSVALMVEGKLITTSSEPSTETASPTLVPEES